MEAKPCLVTERRAGWQNKGWTDQDHLGDSCLFFQSCCNGPSWKSRWTLINQPVRTCSMLTLCSPLMSLWAICSQWPESWRLGPQLGNKAMGAWLSVTAEGTLKRPGCRAPAPPALLGQEPPDFSQLCSKNESGSELPSWRETVFPRTSGWQISQGGV